MTPEPQADQATSQEQVEFEFMWQGPLPPPAFLRQLNDIVPNGADRLIGLLESETRHRHTIERRSQLFPLIDGLAGRTTALLFAVACLGAALYALSLGYQWPTIVISGALILHGMNALMRRGAGPERQKPNPKLRERS